MAKLDINRMSNATKLSRVDNAHVQLEEDLEDILGIPDNTPISKPIFGTTPAGDKAIQADGSIRGIMRFYEVGVTSDVNQCAGFEFTDQTETKRLVLQNSGLKIYKLEGQVWTAVADLENPGSGSGLLNSLADVDPSISPNDGDLLAWNTAGGYWEAVAAAAGTGRTRFADLDDTPAAAFPAPGFSFADTDVDKLVYVASQSSLGFRDAPLGIGAPFVMTIESPDQSAVPLATNELWTSSPTTWQDVYLWEYTTYLDDGGFLTDDPTLITNDGSFANKFITLEAGLYHISFWYQAENPNKWGSRGWRVVGTNSVGPATLGIQKPANLFWQLSKSDAENPVSLPEEHYMGSMMLVQIADGTIHFEVFQDSGSNLRNPVYWAAIQKVK